MDEHDQVAQLCATIASAVAGHGDLDEAIADLHRLPSDLPARPRLAAALVEMLVTSDPLTDLGRMRHLAGTVAIADRAANPDPRWLRVRRRAEVLGLMYAAAEGQVPDLDAALARLDALLGGNVDDPALPVLVTSARTAIGIARSIQHGDVGAMSRFPEAVQQMMAGMPQDARLTAIGDVITAYGEILAANGRGADVTDGMRTLSRALERLPPGELRAMGEESVSTLAAAMRADGRLDDAQLAAFQARAGRTDRGRAEQALSHTAVAMIGLGGGHETDPGRVDGSIADLREALDLTGPDDPLRVFHLAGLALGLMRRNELTNSTDDLREARTLLEEARVAAVGPQHAQWGMINEMLADIGRLLGEDRASHRAAVEGLRSHLWQVLVQPDLASAGVAVRRAGADAVATARRCLMAHDPESAVRALDAGRGLALFAATEVRTLGERLRDTGHSELARRWEDAADLADPDRLTGDLRREVLTVLADGSAGAAFLDPPELDEIGRALVTLDAEALVYLVPGEESMPGFAVIASATGSASYLALPNLDPAAVPHLDRYLDTLARRAARLLRDADPAGPDLDGGFADSVDDVCRWAWRAAIGPVVESYLERIPRPPGRCRRMVLIPMGDLARVPWQAALRADGTRAVEHVAISQAPSARMLCRSAAAPPVPPTPLGLLVGDPNTAPRETEELVAARREAFAIRQGFYRGARYLGRRPNGSDSPSGPATAAQIRDWLTTADPTAGALLHLACHADLRTGTGGAPPTACLLLHGGEELTAAELLALMDTAPARAVGLVVLAACHTDRSAIGYDEAYSLGSAFLAGGARSVLSTQWAVDDRATSALMFVFHHFLGQGRPAWAALRDAQLWMLDPGRVVPEEMPSGLSRELDHAALGTVTAWAGFVHSGQ